MGRRVAIGALLSSACSLEDALGVDGDGGGTTSGQTQGQTQSQTQGQTQAGPAGTAVDDTTMDGATEPADETATTADPEPTACEGRSLRVAGFNVESLGAQGSESFEALASVLARIDADIVCLEEVDFWDTATLFALANQAGYPDVIQANEPPAIGGDFTNACLSRSSLSMVGSYSGWDLSSDSEANDVGRDILVVRADLSGPGEPPCAVGVVSLHLKSGQEPIDWFRRQVEAERVVQAVALYRDAYPDDPMVIMGDLNESLDDPALGSTFTGLPEGLPPSYHMGADIELPLVYQPFDTFEGLGFSIAPATQEDSSRDQTWNDAVRLDYVLHADAQLQGALVYNACRDDGTDDPPAGQWLPLAGEPLDCSLSDLASDHFPVMADLVLP